MESKHTPGPWIDGDTIDREHIRALRAHGIGRCDCDGCKRMLHAAAPDLLAALVGLHDYLRGCGEVRDTLEMLQRSHAAIAKATGGEK